MAPAWLMLASFALGNRRCPAVIWTARCAVALPFAARAPDEHPDVYSYLRRSRFAGGTRPYRVCPATVQVASTTSFTLSVPIPVRETPAPTGRCFVDRPGISAFTGENIVAACCGSSRLMVLLGVG